MIRFLTIILCATSCYGNDWRVEYDSGKQRPVYAVEHLDSAPPNISRPDVSWRGPYSAANYAHSGWDIGHLVPQDDFPGRETFTLTNAVPQAPGLNRNYWRTLERAAQQAIKPVTIVTIPVYPQKQRLTMGRDKIPVPSHIYKAVGTKGQPVVLFVAANMPWPVSVEDNAYAPETVRSILRREFPRNQ